MSKLQLQWSNETDSQSAWLSRLDGHIPGGEQGRNVLLAIFSLYLAYQIFWASSHDPREPKLIKSRIPILGHIVGIYKHGSRHFTWIAQKTGLPIYLLPMIGGGRIAIANTPEVLSAIDKNPTAVAFIPLAALVIKKLSGLSAEGNRILCGKTAGPDKHEGYMHILSKGVHSTLAPGRSLDAVTSIVAYDLNDSIQELHGKTTRMNVLHWFRHAFGISSTDGIYGPGNPFKDPKVEAGFWAFDDSISDLLISPITRLTCPFGHKGRADAWAGFEKYFANGDHEQGSDLTKARYKTAADLGMNNLDIAKLEVTMIIGILTNTVPTIFWAVYYVYRDPSLLEKLRQEIAAVAIRGTDKKTGAPAWTLPTSALKEKCPLLTAVINETLRHRTCGISSRMVTEDCVLNNKYLLKKGTVCELPNNVLHSNEAYWGPTVNEFDPTRFLKDASSKEARMARGAFRPFGGGVSRCAGQYQAMSQMIGGLALLIMSNDCAPADGAEWKFPGAHGHTIAAAVDLPSSDLWLDVSPRKGYEDQTWKLDPKL
ncbi:Putative cytochrome P450 [Colletotrichum destructivum]|uniref:Cytochrome P450 n=1 Tax=Colletotrichum destructivum TaxID=34406 RepID=A0AAX4ISZ6_9PEZI|nr:Putative cytochrome P450 [Colletotrichum destructivum]